VLDLQVNNNIVQWRLQRFIYKPCFSGKIVYYFQSVSGSFSAVSFSCCLEKFALTKSKFQAMYDGLDFKINYTHINETSAIHDISLSQTSVIPTIIQLWN